MNKVLVIYESESGMNCPIREVVTVTDDDALSKHVAMFFKRYVLGYEAVEIVNAISTLMNNGFCWINEKWLLSLNEISKSM